MGTHAELKNSTVGANTHVNHFSCVLDSDVGRDVNEIEFTLGVKLTIRDSEAEAVRVWKAAMEANRTPMSRVDQDSTFWNGTPEQIAERLRPYMDLGFRTVISEQPAPYDTETLERFIGEVKPMVEKA